MEANGRESQHASFLAADLVNQTATRLDRADCRVSNSAYVNWLMPGSAQKASQSWSRSRMR